MKIILKSESFLAYRRIYFFFFKLAPTFLVVHENGVLGRYIDLERAKERLKTVANGKRLIAELDCNGRMDLCRINGLNRNPHIIGNQAQETSQGFSSNWDNQNDINLLMDICQVYLDFAGKMLVLMKVD